MNNEKYLKKLVRDVAKRTGTTFEKDVDYIKICINLAYYKGRSSAMLEARELVRTTFKK